MSLIPKSPVEKPCEAETFEEAFHKNRERLSFELREAQSLVDTKKPDENLNGVDPDFWRGCEVANNRAFFIYNEEIKKLRERVALRLADANKEDRGKEFNSGFSDVTGAWIKALKTGDPSVIVYW